MHDHVDMTVHSTPRTFRVVEIRTTLSGHTSNECVLEVMPKLLTILRRGDTPGRERRMTTPRTPTSIEVLLLHSLALGAHLHFNLPASSPMNRLRNEINPFDFFPPNTCDICLVIVFDVKIDVTDRSVFWITRGTEEDIFDCSSTPTVYIGKRYLHLAIWRPSDCIEQLSVLIQRPKSVHASLLVVGTN